MAARPANPRLRREILTAATAIVETRDVDGLTMREVAQRIGYSPTTIYLHFKNKGELLDNVVTEVFELFEDHLRAAETTHSPTGKLRQRLRAYVEWAIRNPSLYRLMFETMFDQELVKDTKPEVMRQRMRGLNHMAALMDMAAEQGLAGVGTEDSQRLSLVSWAAVHGIASLSISWRMFGIPGVMLPVDEVVDRALALTDDYLAMWLGNKDAGPPVH